MRKPRESGLIRGKDASYVEFKFLNKCNNKYLYSFVLITCELAARLTKYVYIYSVKCCQMTSQCEIHSQRLPALSAKLSAKTLTGSRSTSCRRGRRKLLPLAERVSGLCAWRGSLRISSGDISLKFTQFDSSLPAKQKKNQEWKIATSECARLCNTRYSYSMLIFCIPIHPI